MDMAGCQFWGSDGNASTGSVYPQNEFDKPYRDHQEDITFNTQKTVHRHNVVNPTLKY